MVNAFFKQIGNLAGSQDATSAGRSIDMSTRRETGTSMIHRQQMLVITFDRSIVKITILQVDYTKLRFAFVGNKRI